MARPQNLEEDVNSPMNDDGDLPFSEPVAEKDDHSEDETQVEEPDRVAEESRDVVREPLRLPHRLLLLLNRRKEWNRSQKGHASMRQSCCTMHFSQKLLDPKRSNGMA